MLNYQKKYLKYKMKYLELKNQIGGILPAGVACNFISKSVDNANLLLKRYKEEKICNDDDIRRFGPEGFIKAGLLKLTYDSSNQPLIELFDIKDLKKAGFKPKDLYYHNSEHFTPEKLLHEGEYSIQELMAVNFSESLIAKELIRKYNYTEDNLRNKNISFESRKTALLVTKK